MNVPEIVSPRTPSPRTDETSPHRPDGARPLPGSLQLDDLQNRRRRKSFDTDGDDRHSRSSSRSGSLSINIPAAPSQKEAALSALKYLPMPVLVLSSLTTIMLANEAMARLMCSEDPKATDHGGGSFGHTSTVSQFLLGQTLSQIGVDMIQGDSPVWVDWQAFLEEIGGTEAEGGSTPKPSNTGPQELSSSNLNAAVVHDISVDVVLSPTRCAALRSASSPTTVVNSQVTANMIISVWYMDGSRYYTLTFTASALTSRTSRPPSSRAVTMPRASSHASSPRSASSASSSGRGGYRSRESPSSLSNLSSPTFMPSLIPQGPPSKSSLASNPSVLQKATKLREALLNSMNLPCYALWEDASVGIPNKALMKLSPAPSNDYAGHEEEFLLHFEAYTSDFSRLLEVDEYPIVRVIKSRQKLPKGTQVGLKDAHGTPRVYDVSGDTIHDDATGAFCAGFIILKDVTEYVNSIQAQKDLNEQQFEVLANMTPQMVWTTRPDGWHDWFSQRWYDYTGLTADESIGEGWRLPFHPDDVVVAGPRWKHCLATGEEYNTEYRCRRRDGSWRWFLGRALPMKDESGAITRWFGTCTDIHESVRAREKAKLDRAQLLQVLDTAKVTIFAVNRDRQLQMLEGSKVWRRDNEEPRDMIGRTYDEIFEHQMNETDKLVLRKYMEPMRRIVSGQSTKEASEVQIPHTGRWYRTSYLPVCKDIDSVSTLDGCVGVSVDITELREQELALRSRDKENSKLAANALAAKEASRMKSQFLANMSHEIRTPIAGVIGMCDLLLDTKLSQEQEDCAENISRSANGLLTVINDILDFSKVESGRLDVESVQFSLSMVLKDVHKMLSFAAVRKNLGYESRIAPLISNDLRVIGDPGRLRQILQNLLTNSIKFTSEGQVVLSASVLEETSNKLSVEFVVQDTGIGIDGEARKRLFTPFSQADTSTARRFGGSGLGLSISKSLVELMGGRIKLDSEVGVGTQAVFSIPFKRADAMSHGSALVDLDAIPQRLVTDMSISGASDEQRPTPPMTPPSTAPGTRTVEQTLAAAANGRLENAHVPLSSLQMALSDAERNKVHILVVEDNHINQQIALKTIKKLGFSVSAVWNGKEALDYLLEPPSVTRPSPDVILMDVQMPLLDGYRATQIIRTLEPFSGSPFVPIVAMTASAIQGDKEKCIRAGMDDYLAKPVRGKTLETMLLKWVIAGKKKRSASKTERTLPWQRNEMGFDGDYFANNDNQIRPSISHTIDSADDIKPVPDSVPADISKSSSLDTLDYTDGSKPSGLSDDHRLQIAEVQEHAIGLRNDKLISAADNPRLQHHRQPSTGMSATPQLKLTEANVDKLEDEQANSHQRVIQGLGLHRSGQDSMSSLQVQLEPHSRNPSGEIVPGAPVTKSPSSLRPASVRQGSSASTLMPDSATQELSEDEA